MKKSELAIERDKWLSSDEGEKCCDFSTLTGQKYLRNRIELAYLAGAKGNEAAKEAVCQKLLGVATGKS